MKVLTPEIAWHETLPIYSCDLQPFTLVSKIRDMTLREPLAELPFDDATLTDAEKLKEETAATKEEGEKRIGSIFGGTWTRLATAGGDSMVRLWRVNLEWRPPGSVTVATFKKPLPKGILEGSSGKRTASSTTAATTATATAAAGDDVSGGVEVPAPVSEGLVFLATLKRHERLVNVVRWSPSGEYLASGGDDQFIIIWHMQLESASESTSQSLPGDDGDEPKSLETWSPLRSLRRHLEDVYDLCWSPDDTAFISGSVDQSVILWNLDLSVEGTSSGTCKSVVLRDHKHYVQGVAWDPLGVYVASLSSDRSCRIYKVATNHCVITLSKVDKCHLFQDDSWKSFFRRPSFSPDGLLLICPAGNLETAPFAGDMSSAVSSTSNKGASIASKVDAADSDVTLSSTTAPQHAAHIFLRNWTKRPCVSLPTGSRPVIAVRFCPQPFRLRITNPDSEVALSSLFDLPYRWIFCLVLDDGLLFFDTQQVQPFAQVGQIHYQSLNDAAWSSDGRLVTVTSTDGYCSLIHFSVEELGVPYRGPLGARTVPPTANFSVETGSNDENVIEHTAKTTPEKDEKPQMRAMEALKSEKRRHISFESGIHTPERPHIPLPVTPNTGRYLSAPVLTSPTATTPTIIRSKKTGEKRRIPFITLSKEVESNPLTGPHTEEKDQNKN
ncbi:chromatin assembly factor 1 subunit b [Echinococcus multilocularis]|uniref:Chromatin assembly factor 1 subunit b n=1 Tax=Echinococcus multilocularis TaxID=6211 RepID=A0A068Y5B3_ECHMU|nr:chromatin assembly factor 1 subunit b [Echinococcus multilocularis]